MKALKWLFMDHAPLILRPKIDAANALLDGQDARKLHVRTLRRQ